MRRTDGSGKVYSGPPSSIMPLQFCQEAMTAGIETQGSLYKDNLFLLERKKPQYKESSFLHMTGSRWYLESIL